MFKQALAAYEKASQLSSGNADLEAKVKELRRRLHKLGGGSKPAKAQVRDWSHCCLSGSLIIMIEFDTYGALKNLGVTPGWNLLNPEFSAREDECVTSIVHDS